jgi:hypothetical protein
MIKEAPHTEEAVQKALVRGFRANNEAFDYGTRVAELAASSISIVTVEREDFGHAVELTRSRYVDIDSALTLAATEREYGPCAQVATGVANFDSLKASGTLNFDLFRARDVLPNDS